jgi:5'-methylthioadenosine phosphorylase
MMMMALIPAPFAFRTGTDAIADIGVFGGSGFYQFLENAQTITVETPYGAPSDDITLGTVDGKRVAFLPRHSKKHTIAPHKINYRANVWAMKSLGVHTVISPCAAGSLQRHVEPGHVVVCDQYVDRTHSRVDTFYEGPIITHVSAADPFDEQGRQWAIQAAKEVGLTVHETGTVVVIQGPRFSTKSESAWFRSQGWEVINMTQYPEVHLVRELNMYPINLSLITDYDCGVDGIAPVSHEEVLAVFKENTERLKQLLFRLVALVPAHRPEADFVPHVR